MLELSIMKIFLEEPIPNLIHLPLAIQPTPSQLKGQIQEVGIHGLTILILMFPLDISLQKFNLPSMQ